MTSNPPGGPTAPGSDAPSGADDRDNPYRFGAPEPSTTDAWGRPLGPPVGRTPRTRDEQRAPTDRWGPAPGSYPSGPPSRGTNGMAIAGFVFGLLAVLLFFTTVIALVLGVLGLVLSIVAVRAVSSTGPRRGQGGRGLAIAGIVLGSVGILVAGLIIALVLPIVRDCSDRYGPTGSQYQNCIVDRFM